MAYSLRTDFAQAGTVTPIRMVAAFALVLGLAQGLAVVSARAVEPTRVEIVEHGIYTLDIDATTHDGNGIGQNQVSNICHVSTTTMIPMKPTLTFGFRYRVWGPSTDGIERLTKVVTFPTEVTPPGAPKPLKSYAEVFSARISMVGYIGYGFDEPWELMRGIWTFQLFQRGRLLAEQNFTIVDDPQATVPHRDSKSNCFQMSSL